MTIVGKSFSQKFQTLISTSSQAGINLALLIGRIVPPIVGYPLVRCLAKFIVQRRTWQMVRGYRLNQWVAGGMRYSSHELDQAVQETMLNQAISLYELYRYLAWPNSMKDRLILHPEFSKLIDESHYAEPGHGKILAGIHLSNFDFALHALVQCGWHGLGITVAELPSGYKKQFELRRNSGLELVTASVNSFRLAIDRLKAGEMVLTGIDRPLEKAKYRPAFFGYPAPLPVHHIYLALKSDAPVYLVGVILGEDSLYRLNISKPIYMEHGPDRDRELVCNAEAVLSVAEQFISQTPHQWAMYFPVWPDLVETLPP